MTDALVTTGEYNPLLGLAAAGDKDIARARLAYWMAQGVQLSLSDELTA